MVGAGMLSKIKLLYKLVTVYRQRLRCKLVHSFLDSQSSEKIVSLICQLITFSYLQTYANLIKQIVMFFKVCA